MIGELKKILLIGGTGVISSAVVNEAIRHNIDVTIMTRGLRNIPSGVTSIICDKHDYAKQATLIHGSYDAIIDFLCFSEEDVEQSFKFYSKYTNQYFFISSGAVYANENPGEVLFEDAPKVQPRWSYSVNKWAAEQKLVNIANTSSCNYTIVRPAITYDDTRIPYGISPQYGYHWTLCARILAGKPIITWNNGENIRNMMRVEDFAVGLVGLIGNSKAYNEAFNICGDETPSYREVLDILGQYLKRDVITIDIPAEYYAKQIPNRSGELLEGRAKSSINSNVKLKSLVLEFKHNISIKDGINRTLDAYKNQNYQQGIDWAFDAETDRVIENWCKTKGLSVKGMNLRYVDYLGNATWQDKYLYMNARYHDKIWMKVVRKLMKICSR